MLDLLPLERDVGCLWICLWVWVSVAVCLCVSDYSYMLNVCVPHSLKMYVYASACVCMCMYTQHHLPVTVELKSLIASRPHFRNSWSVIQPAGWQLHQRQCCLWRAMCNTLRHITYNNTSTCTISSQCLEQNGSSCNKTALRCTFEWPYVVWWDGSCSIKAEVPIKVVICWQSFDVQLLSKMLIVTYRKYYIFVCNSVCDITLKFI